MVYYVAEIVSQYPALRNSADKLFSLINVDENNEITVSFRDVRGITHSFAAQYDTSKKISKKKISEVDMNENVVLMFKLLGKERHINTIKSDKVYTLHI